MRRTIRFNQLVALCATIILAHLCTSELCIIRASETSICIVNV